MSSRESLRVEVQLCVCGCEHAGPLRGSIVACVVTVLVIKKLPEKSSIHQLLLCVFSFYYMFCHFTRRSMHLLSFS